MASSFVQFVSDALECRLVDVIYIDLTISIRCCKPFSSCCKAEICGLYEDLLKLLVVLSICYKYIIRCTLNTQRLSLSNLLCIHWWNPGCLILVLFYLIFAWMISSHSSNWKLTSSSYIVHWKLWTGAGRSE